MTNRRVIALSGGVGGAKLADGLAQVLDDGRLTVVTNTGDDFDHLGLRICPDTDTVLYTLAGLADRERGWGRAGETWTFMEVLSGLGGPEWFNLGDGDLALHVLRSDALRRGQTLSRVIADVAKSLGVPTTVLPMSDQDVRTIVLTDEGRLAFQEYFVHRQCKPAVTGFEFEGAVNSRPNPDLADAVGAEPGCIVVAPSNPFVSVDPILAVPGLGDMLRACGAPIVAVSPIVGGRAIKGPAAKMFGELGIDVSALGVARHYHGFIDGLIVDEQDADAADEISALGMAVHVVPTVMQSTEDRKELARATLRFAETLHGKVPR